MTKEEALKVLDTIPTIGEQVDALEMAIKALEQTRWIPIKIRLITEEEKEEIGYEYDFIYDCSLPDDGQDVLITTPYGVQKTTFYTDYGCYFESYEDEGDVIAWMPLPQPYREIKHTCSECIIKDTDACSRGNTEADEVACEDFVGGESDAK